MTALRGPLSGWRLFTVDGGVLRPPFASWQWSDALTAADDWKAGPNLARCLTEEHRVPSAGCGCGVYAVQSLPALLRQARTLRLQESPRTVLEDCGVLARVVVAGLILPSTDRADPPSCVRASVGRVVELWLAPEQEPHADALSARYGVPVAVVHDWQQAAPDARLWPALSRRPFGGADLTQSGVRDALCKVAHDLADGLRGDLTRTDAARALFDSGPRPTWKQATAFVSTVVDVLAPETASNPDGFLAARPPSKVEDLSRAFGRVGT